MEKLLWPEGAPFAAGTTDEDRPAITPYLLEGEGHPAVIVLPGGGYGMRAYHEGEPIALWLNSIGVSAFVLRYRVAPYRYPCALLDAQRAIRTVRHEAKRYGIDPRRVGILGFSAGGHAASSAATHYDAGRPDAEDEIERQSSRPDLAILCYPVITMRDPHTHEGSRANLLGPEPDPELVALMSNDEQVTSDTPPTFLWHTSDDGAVPVENSLQFAAALRKHGVPFDLHVYARGRHGLGLAEDDAHVRGWTDACASWLKYNGF
ncbi:beta-xylanase [Cohnella xylanilytica]|uniref:Alpha/beta hydrolase n=1 Tax=Cohnella xylanilytica TaxID=557555 RepID=A0A841TXG4_9BACL|nr:alpha/beta hydrolase [Cohnella xylanilytica]MBB6690631.1 alpha/beta hydrolase [Cohnella xylanilytica]GIO15081.1 beta-xylanase [Cohnella xylanilytica]